MSKGKEKQTIGFWYTRAGIEIELPDGVKEAEIKSITATIKARKFVELPPGARIKITPAPGVTGDL